MSATGPTLQSDRHKFPGLLPDEVLVIRAWLALHQLEYDSFDYNVRIGQGSDPGPGFSAEMRKQNIVNTQLRIDAVGYKMGVPTIIEVKRRCTPSNVGQILTYDSVWRKENPNSAAPKMLLICANYSPHIVPRLNEAGIGLDVVQVDFSALRTLRLG
jgi:hypothetical protein